MTTTPMRSVAPMGCGGDGCEAQRPWPLHHVRHRGGIFLRLCTSCVLKYHPGSFCTSCFTIVDGSSLFSPQSSAPPTSGAAVAHCSKCPSVAHLGCLPASDLAADFVCPGCKNPDGFSYFDISAASDGEVIDQKRPTTIDLRSAKVLLTATRLAAASMSRAAAAARIEAEKKVDVAVVARKRARDMLVNALTISKKGTGKIKMKELNMLNQNKASNPITEVIEPRETKKSSPMPYRIEGQKGVHSREKEKWMRFNGTALMGHVSNQGSLKNNKSQKDPSAAEQSTVRVELKDSVKSIASPPRNLEHDEKKQLLSVGIKEGVQRLPADNISDPNKPSSVQDIKAASILS